MPSIADFPITKYQRQYIQAPLEVDLLAFFMVAKDEILELLSKADEERWNADEFTAEVDMLLDGTSDRVEFQRMVEKARGFPDYTIRQRKDGYWHIKIPNQGWKICGGPDHADVKAILAAAGIARPPHIIPYDPNAPDGAGASLHPSQEPEKKKRQELDDWRRKDPKAFVSAIAHGIENQHGPHPIFDKSDIKAKLLHGTLDPDELLDLAKQFNVDPPDKWENMDRKEKLAEDREKFINELLDGRDRIHGKQDRQGLLRRYRQMGDDQLLRRADQYMPKGPESLKREAEEKAKKQAEMKAVDDRKDQIKQEYGLQKDKIKDLSYADAVRQHRDVIVLRIIHAEDFDNVAELEHRMNSYKNLNTAALVRRAEMHLGEDKVHKVHAMAAKQANLKKVYTHKSQMYHPAEEHLYDAPEGATSRVVLGDAAQGNVNVTYQVFLKDANGNEKPAVWKSYANQPLNRGHRIRAGIPDEEQWLRERGAYEVNAIVGLGNSPPVVLREFGADGAGAMMDFVEGKPWCAAGAQYHDFPKEEWQKLALHGYLIGTEDMHAKNYMADLKNKKLNCIDNGLTLPEKRDYYRNNAHEALITNHDCDLPPAIADLVTVEKRDKAVKAMEFLGIDKKAIEWMKKRFDYVITNKALPKGNDWGV